MNDDAVMTLLKVVAFLGKVGVFVFVGAFFGGIAYIWADTFWGWTTGLVAALAVGVAAGWLASAALDRFARWLFPDLR